MRNAGLEEAQAGIKIAGRNINNLRYADDTTLMAESEEELKSLLMKVKEDSEEVQKSLLIKVKEESEKFGLRLPQHSENKGHGIQSHHSMGNRWRNNVNSVRLYFFGLQIIADGDCSHEIKRHLLLGRNYDQPR